MGLFERVCRYAVVVTSQGLIHFACPPADPYPAQDWQTYDRTAQAAEAE